MWSLIKFVLERLVAVAAAPAATAAAAAAVAVVELAWEYRLNAETGLGNQCIPKKLHLE